MNYKSELVSLRAKIRQWSEVLNLTDYEEIDYRGEVREVHNEMGEEVRRLGLLIQDIDEGRAR